MSRLAIIAGDAHPALGREIAAALDTTPIAVSISSFADGETRVRIEGDLRDADVLIVQPTSTPTNERLMTLVLLADAARGMGAKRVTALIPYFGYARQDVRREGEPLSARLAASILACAGIERVVALELHSPALESAFPMPLVHLRADDLMLSVIRRWDVPNLVVVAPDAGGLKRAQRYATALDAPLAAVAKHRPEVDTTAALQVLGDVCGCHCLIVDDMASTGNTVAGAARALRHAGANEVHAVFIHAVMAPGALDTMLAAGVSRILTTDSVCGDVDPRIERVALAHFLAHAVA